MFNIENWQPFKYRIFYHFISKRQNGKGGITITTNLPYTDDHWVDLQEYVDDNVVELDAYGEHPQSVITNLYLFPATSWKEKLQRVIIRLWSGIL